MRQRRPTASVREAAGSAVPTESSPLFKVVLTGDRCSALELKQSVDYKIWPALEVEIDLMSTSSDLHVRPVAYVLYVTQSVVRQEWKKSLLQVKVPN